LYFKLWETNENCCPIAFQSLKVKALESRKKNSPIINCYATCMQPSCPRYYRFFVKSDEKITGDFVNIKICTYQEVIHDHQEKMYRRKATGELYKMIGKAVNEHGATNYLTKAINKNADACFKTDNYTALPTSNALRMAAYRSRQDDLVDNDMFTELRLAQTIYFTNDTISEKIKGYSKSFF
jgi:hypothetical protein